MRRGDVVTVAAAGDYGKPRPAVIVQTDALPVEHKSLVVCQMTSDGRLSCDRRPQPWEWPARAIACDRRYVRHDPAFARWSLDRPS
jgi:mRNA-degrading endonuclease toxin of MazEF toxin-antitoxin module